MSPDKKNTNHEIEWNGESMPEGVPVSAAVSYTHLTLPTKA